MNARFTLNRTRTALTAALGVLMMAGLGCSVDNKGLVTGPVADGGSGDAVVDTGPTSTGGRPGTGGIAVPGTGGSATGGRAGGGGGETATGGGSATGGAPATGGTDPGTGGVTPGTGGAGTGGAATGGAGTGGAMATCNANTCANGCCNGNNCVTGSRTNQRCGTGGGACAPCGACSQCSESTGTCAFTPGARWDVLCASATIPPTKPGNVVWDSTTGAGTPALPDPYCQFTLESSGMGGTAQGRTTLLMDTLTPMWNQSITPSGGTNITYNVLTAQPSRWMVAVIDDDGSAANNDTLCTVRPHLTAADFAAGSVTLPATQDCLSLTLNLVCAQQ